MVNERLSELLEKIPILPLFFLGLVYLGWDGYQFVTDPTSPLGQKQTQLTAVQAENVRLEDKVKKAKEFFKSLDIKREEIRTLATQLEQMKTTLSDQLDVPRFIKLVITEAAKTGIRVVSIKPTEPKSYEYYLEQPFDLTFRGVYVQVLVFLERLANLDRVIRVDSFDIKRQGSSLAQYVDLGGVIRIKTYKYVGSRADEVSKSGAAAPQAQTPGGSK